MFNSSKIGTPFKGYYITAYGLAVKHGFCGTEEEWLESLNGGNAEFRYNSKTKMIEYKHSKTDEWTELMTLAEFQEGVIKDTLTEMNGLRDAAAEAIKSAQGSAELASEAAESTMHDRQAVTVLKNEAERAAEDARGYAEDVQQAVESIKEAEYTYDIDLTTCTTAEAYAGSETTPVIEADKFSNAGSYSINFTGYVEFSCEMDVNGGYCVVVVNGVPDLDAAVPGYPFTFAGEVTSPIEISFNSGNLTFHYFRTNKVTGSSAGLMPEGALKKLDDLDEEAKEHAANRENPHQVTAEQIGVYTKIETDAKITTVKDFAEGVDMILADHLYYARNNPHEVTAEQVGAYTKDETDNLLESKAASDHTHAQAEYTYDMVDVDLTTCTKIIAEEEDDPAEFDSNHLWGNTGAVFEIDVSGYVTINFVADEAETVKITINDVEQIVSSDPFTFNSEVTSPIRVGIAFGCVTFTSFKKQVAAGSTSGMMPEGSLMQIRSLETKVGDIDTALDGILAIQKELWGEAE